MATRHQVRETIVGFLYAQDVGNDKISNFKDEIFEEKKIRNQQKEFAVELYQGILDNLGAVDKAINEYLKEWELKKVGAIERAILRLGAYELLYTKLDSAVIINEAIELAKELGNETSSKFVNGVLDSIKKSLS
ncbi:MAG: transcription antitermination factor NusB [Campylobacteraceae bacterium]|nr:transcription antitermination factor NusB [Campylobacteraceae bacterium]